MKDRILEFIDNQLGKVLMALALLWAGWTIFANWYHPLENNLVVAEVRPVYVEMDPKAKSQDTTEVYYVAGDPVPYIDDTHTMIALVSAIIFRPVELDIPQLSVKRPPQLLPDPGPSLEGTDKLPRFGEEIPPPSAADMPDPKAKGTPVAPPRF